MVVGLWRQLFQKLWAALEAADRVPVPQQEFWRAQFLAKLLAMRLQAYYSGDKVEENRLQDLISSLVKQLYSQLSFIIVPFVWFWYWDSVKYIPLSLPYIHWNNGELAYSPMQPQLFVSRENYEIQKYSYLILCPWGLTNILLELEVLSSPAAVLWYIAVLLHVLY